MGDVTGIAEKGGFDVSELSRLFASYCSICHVCGQIYDRDGALLDGFFMPESARSYYEQRISEDSRMIVISSFRDFDAENVIPIRTPLPFIMARAVCVRGDDGKVIAVLMVYGINHEMVHEEDVLPSNMQWTDVAGFDEATSFLEQLGIHFYRQKGRSEDLSDRLVEKDKDSRALKEQLERADVMTSLLKMLESENDFRKVTEDILTETGEYLGLSGAFVLRKLPVADDEPEPMVDMVCEWTDRDVYPIMTHFGRVPISIIPFWNGRSYTIGSDSIMPDNFRGFFHSYDIEAGIFLPIFIRDEVGMYLGLVHRKSPRRWKVDEIRFLNDVRRIVQTILTKRITKNSLASSYAAIDAILENAGAGICVRENRSGEILYENETFSSMFSDSADKVMFERVMQEHSVHAGVIGEDSDPRVRTRVREFYAENAGRWFTYNFAAIDWVDERRVTMCTLYDISQLKKYQRQIERQADLDDLTGLYNRHRFHKDFEKSIQDAVRSAGQGALLFLDLDDFNALNDGLGHVLGDQFLIMASESLQQIIGGRAQCYRIGGDQFAILVPYSESDRVEQLIDTILARFEKPWRISENAYYCTICIGAVSFPRFGTHEDTLSQRADYALQMAKKAGKNQYAIFGEKDESEPSMRLDLEKAMRDAVADGCHEFEVYYQPVVDISKPGHPCCGAEALVRWNSKKLGFMVPDKFIPLAEYLGLIVPIGEHVLVEACRRCRYWNDFGHPDYRVHVNLSVIQLLQEDVVDVIENALEVSGLYPGNLTLEVTESLAINDMKRMKSILEGIHTLGVRLALDDFGTGYSSLNHLKHMPLDVIKIDRCFVNDVGKDDFSDAFIKTVSDLASTIDVNVVVEGVENISQEDALGDMKIDMIQGYLYDKPLPQNDFEKKYLGIL